MAYDSQHFLDFIKTLKDVLEQYPENDTKFQESQVNGLIEAEREFRKALMRHKYGWDVYEAFIRYIMVEKHNISKARPFFRERDVKFNSEIAQAIRDPNHHRRLPRYDINFQFISFAVRQRQWGRDPASRKVMRLARDVFRRRKEIIELNMPLAISQARKFRSHNRASHHDFMDMVQVAAGGLSVGTDKYVGPYTTGFRGMLLGRVVGDLIEANSETFIHFFPADKRRLYRLRKIAASLREGINGVDLNELTRLLNRKERSGKEHATKPNEVHHLVNAASVVLASSLPSVEDEEGGPGNPIERYADSAENRPDVLLEEAQARRVVADAIARLPALDQKILRLRGVDLDTVGLRTHKPDATVAMSMTGE